MGFHLTRFCPVLFALLIAGCDQLGIGYTAAGEIAAAPGRYEGQEVKVRGIARATAKMPFVDLRTFILESDQTDLLIITEGALPAEGEEVALRGVVHSAAIVDGRAFGLRVREVERL